MFVARTRLTLIESSRPRDWGVRDHLASLTAHVALVVLLIAMAQQVDPITRLVPAGTNVERLVFLKVTMPTSKARDPDVVAPMKRPKPGASRVTPDQVREKLEKLIAMHAQLFEPPMIVSLLPVDLPGFDITRAMPTTEDFGGEFSVVASLSRARMPVDPDRHSGPFDEAEVEMPVMALPDNPIPRYPGLLESAGVEGEVIAEFVVDTTGRVETKTLHILSATHALFARAVRDALVRARFYPALIGRRAVPMRARQPFLFRLIRQ
jgi:protein TonB